MDGMKQALSAESMTKRFDASGARRLAQRIIATNPEVEEVRKFLEMQLAELNFGAPNLLMKALNEHGDKVPYQIANMVLHFVINAEPLHEELVQDYKEFIREAREYLGILTSE